MTKRELTGNCRRPPVGHDRLLPASRMRPHQLLIPHARPSRGWIAGRNCQVARGVVLSACLIRLVSPPAIPSLRSFLVLSS